MEDKGNRRRRIILAGILAALAIAFGIERCTHEQPEEEPAVQHTGSHGIDVPATAVQKGIAPLPQESPGPAFRETEKPANTRVAERTETGTCTTSTVLPSGTCAGNTETGNVIPDSLPAPQMGEEHTEDKIPDSAFPAATEPQTGKGYAFSHRHLFRLGLRAGTGYSMITGLGSIIEAYDVRPQFTMEEKGGLFPRVGIFGTWQYRRLGAELGMDYTRAVGKATEHKSPQDVTETTRFHYDLIAPQFLLRFYLSPKFYMGAGVSAAIPFGSRHVDFTDDRSGEVYRQQAERTQDHLRETLKPRVLFTPAVRLGYADPESGLEAGIEYGFGTNDLIRTRTNDYGYQERTNNVHQVSIFIGYSLPLNKQKK